MAKRGRLARAGRRVLRWGAWGLGLAWATLACVIVALRWIPPPTTSVILQERLSAWRQGAAPPRQQWVDLREISPHASLAVVAAEDQRFPEHWGLDTRAIGDAWSEGQRGERQRGASTITQQVAKNLFLWRGHSYVRKGLEAGLAVLIEVAWPKRRILEVYLNVAEMGEGVFGVEAASRRYFGRPASRLSSDQAALLAAVLPNPRRFRADRPSAYVRERQDWIRQQMRQLGPDYLGSVSPLLTPAEGSLRR